MALYRWVDKKVMVPLYNKTQFHNKKEQRTEMFKDLVKSLRHDSEIKKTVSKGYTLFKIDSLHDILERRKP